MTSPPPRDPAAVPPVDIVIAAVVLVFQLGITVLAARHQPDRRSFDVLAALLLAVGPVALVVRRRYPATVLIAASATVLAFWVLDYPRGPVFLAQIVALVTVVLAGRRLVAAAVLVGGWASFLWLRTLLHRGAAPGPGPAVALGAWLLVLYSAAEWIRVRRERGEEAARLRDEETRRRVSEERVRIARELHDVIAHNISLINVQAATTLHLLDGAAGAGGATHGGTDPRARAALATIKQVSQETLAEVRSVLGALRQVDEAAPRAPAPTLTRIDDLLARTREAGVDAALEVEGTSRPLPSAIDLAAYRIVQESLTNVARHSTTASATVRLAYRDDALVVEVDDDGQTGDAVTAGNGITGMRERAAALGGTLQAGPRPAGGFRVRAWLPWQGAPTA